MKVILNSLFIMSSLRLFSIKFVNYFDDKTLNKKIIEF